MKRINGIIISINEIKIGINNEVENIEIEISKNKTVYSFNASNKDDLIGSIIDFKGFEDNTLDRIIDYIESVLKGL